MYVCMYVCIYVCMYVYKYITYIYTHKVALMKKVLWMCCKVKFVLDENTTYIFPLDLASCKKFQKLDTFFSK